eukprot:CAMPEP_0171125548 /NCGR_PEP_ID=MMETSP0766_2-20121228/111450_1 /TAXON_ID=439317 /ORGANISM="Gambierdiscus australes, Strain CAWD 149" /LENGTH=162 /DNA_ID=CAMNT_0011588537 /DNA_START=100 /DNA_END=584 /DNA_ORIENTATION=+
MAMPRESNALAAGGEQRTEERCTRVSKPIHQPLVKVPHLAIDPDKGCWEYESGAKVSEKCHARQGHKPPAAKPRVCKHPVQREGQIDQEDCRPAGLEATRETKAFGQARVEHQLYSEEAHSAAVLQHPNLWRIQREALHFSGQRDNQDQVLRPRGQEARSKT